jgi:hypothetical protein
MTYNIRKATGRLSKNDKEPAEQNNNTVSRPITAPTVNKKVVVADLENSIEKQYNLFETIVSHNYLVNLSKCPIVAPVPEQLSGMGWYRITKIVLDSETFFPDLLSMLYTALHDVASNVALVVDKKGLDNIEIYLGARDFSGDLYDASLLLKNAIQGYLPGVKTEYAGDKQFISSTNSESYVATYSGIASLRDDKKEHFVQGIEKFIDATPLIPKFTAYFIADNVSQNQALSMINAFASIQDAFSPLVQCQETFNESETTGISSTITDTIGETLTESLSETVTRTEGTNTSYSKSKGSTYSRGTTENPNIFKFFYRKIFGGISSTNSGNAYTEQEQSQNGKHVDNAKSNQKGSSDAHNKQQSIGNGKNSSQTIGSSRQITHTNTQAKRFVDILNRHIERIQNGNPFGLWSVGTYFVTPDKSTSLKLANIYRGCITGEESDIDANAVNVWDQKESKLLLDYLKETRNPRFMVGNINVSSGVMATSKELAIHMSLPQTSIPGVEVRESVSFGRNLNGKSTAISNSAKNSISIGLLSHLGNVSHKEVLLDIEELSKHVFVTGSTGSGKSNTTYLLVNELLNQGKKILVMEPTKGDYRKVFGGRKDVTVYGTRPDEKNMLRINPFAFPDGIRVDEHVERLTEIFGVCWPMYAAMPSVLKSSILAAYQACGWDLFKSKCKYGKLFPTIPDVILQLKQIITTSEYSADTKGDYIGSLQTRLQSLTNGIYASMLSSDAIQPSTLYDKNSIIDLHRIGSMETRSLLMGLIILGLTEWRTSQGEDAMDENLKYVTVLEEAHCILPRVSKLQSQESSNVVGKSVEMIASSIAEMRSYGQGFVIVDQSPSAVDESAIRNTNTKIVMNLPDGDDREIAGKSMGLIDNAQIAELAKLATGEAAVFQRGWSEAVLTAIHEMKKEDRKPLLQKDNFVDLEEMRGVKPSREFISFFIESKNAISDEERMKLEIEILDGKCSSTTKAILVDFLNSNINDCNISESIIDYLGLKEYTVNILNKYSEGSASIIWEIRNFLANNCAIIDTNIQNDLLSMTFKWASLQNKKWYSICIQSMPQSNKKM